MWRYFAIATVVVVAIFAAAAAYHEYNVRIVVRGGRATMPPRSSSSAPPSARASRGLRGNAPWALSALPECLVQVQEWKGPLAYVRAHLPAGSRAIAGPSELRYGDCGISVSADSAVVRRGNDTLTIPPIARLYRFPHGIALVRSTCANDTCAAVLRVYAPSAQVR